MSASSNGYSSVVQILIDAGAYVNAQDSVSFKIKCARILRYNHIFMQRGNTSLMVASYGGHFDTAMVLIEAGADVNLVNKVIL